MACRSTASPKYASSTRTSIGEGGPTMMRRFLAVAAAVAVLGLSACSDKSQTAAPAQATKGPTPSAGPTTSAEPSVSPELAAKLADARAATAKYVNDLAQAQTDGYQIITRMLP